MSDPATDGKGRYCHKASTWHVSQKRHPQQTALVALSALPSLEALRGNDRLGSYSAV